jgi:nicotinamidase-related amidase
MTDLLPTLAPKRTALLVMDVQPAVLGELVAGADALVARLARAIEMARRAGVTIAHVRVGFDDEEYAATPAHNKVFAPIVAVRALHHEAPEAAYHVDVAPQEGDITVRKTRVGAFSTTNLAARLAERGIDTLVLAGVTTAGVILSTVREAADRDYRLFVLEDGTADPDQELHRTLVEKVLPWQAQLIRIDQLPQLLG